MGSILRKNDRVKVLCGKDKGKISSIISIIGEKVLVKGLNLTVKHEKPTKNNPEGGISKKEMYLHRSNVMHCLKDIDQVSRVGFKILDNKKSRFSKRNGKLI